MIFNMNVDHKEQKAYHEAAHALVSDVLFPGSVTLVTIKSINEKVGGMTMCYHPDETDYDWKRSQILVGLAGRAVNELKYGLVDSGSSKDLQKVFDLVKYDIAYICSKGFEYRSLGYNTTSARRERQEIAISAAVDEYYREVKKLLMDNDKYLIAIKEELLKKEILSTEDIERIRSKQKVL